MNKKRTSFLSIGIPSMCVIFSVLCLVILALLTLGTSRQDLQTSRLSLLHSHTAVQSDKRFYYFCTHRQFRKKRLSFQNVIHTGRIS